jgi:hypothetical protein
VKAKGAALKAAEQPIDSGTAAGKAFLDMPGRIRRVRTNLRKERQLEVSIRSVPRRVRAVYGGAEVDQDLLYGFER